MELSYVASSNKDNKKDIIFEMYKNDLLTSERLQFIMENCAKYFDISSNLIKKLMNDKKVALLDIIFSHLKFYDNNFILQLLNYYKNKIVISTSDLNQQLSNEKFKVSISTNYFNSNAIYLINECNKKDINIYIIKYLVEHGADINKANEYGETPINLECEKGNETIVKNLVEHGADINKANKYGFSPLFSACEWVMKP